MNMFARFDENPAMTLQDIKEIKRYRRTHVRMDALTHNVKTVYPPQTKFAGGIITGEHRSVIRVSEISIDLKTELVERHDPEPTFPVSHRRKCAHGN